jgi:hypothetical protein
MRFEALTATEIMLLLIRCFCLHLQGLDPEYGDGMFLRNVGIILQIHKLPKPNTSTPNNKDFLVFNLMLFLIMYLVNYVLLLILGTNVFKNIFQICFITFAVYFVFLHIRVFRLNICRLCIFLNHFVC